MPLAVVIDGLEFPLLQLPVGTGEFVENGLDALAKMDLAEDGRGGIHVAAVVDAADVDVGERIVVKDITIALALEAFPAIAAVLIFGMAAAEPQCLVIAHTEAECARQREFPGLQGHGRIVGRADYQLAVREEDGLAALKVEFKGIDMILPESGEVAREDVAPELLPFRLIGDLVSGGEEGVFRGVDGALVRDIGLERIEPDKGLRIHAGRDRFVAAIAELPRLRQIVHREAADGEVRLDRGLHPVGVHIALRLQFVHVCGVEPHQIF